MEHESGKTIILIRELAKVLSLLQSFIYNRVQYTNGADTFITNI